MQFSFTILKERGETRMSLISPIEPARRNALLKSLCVFAGIALAGRGVMVSNGWLAANRSIVGCKVAYREE